MDRFGSITAATTAVGMTYRQTWTLVRTLNERLAHSSVSITRGGRTTAASLTSFGRGVVAPYPQMERFKAFELLVGSDPERPPRIPHWAQVPDLALEAGKEDQQRPAKRSRKSSGQIKVTSPAGRSKHARQSARSEKRQARKKNT